MVILKDQLNPVETSGNDESFSIVPSWLRDTCLTECCHDEWTWNDADKSHEVSLIGLRNERALFHPNWSNGSAGVRGTVAINRGDVVRYWEIVVSRRLFGTSMMFGVATRSACLHVDAFENLLGKDEHSWALSHKGLLWHRGKCRQYTSAFKENETTTIGMLFDGRQRSLTFFKDGVNLGVAFTNLGRDTEKEHVDIFPSVCSTAAKTEMILGLTLRSFGSLQGRCRAVVARCVKTGGDVNALPLPAELKRYVSEVIGYEGNESRVPGVFPSLLRLKSASCNLFRRRVKQQLRF